MRRADTRALGQLTARSGGPRLPGRGNGKGRKGGGPGARGRGDGARGRERSGLGAGSQVSEQRDGRRGDAGESGNRAPESLQSHCPGLGGPGAEATWWQLAPFKENTEVLFWGRQNFIK